MHYQDLIREKSLEGELINQCIIWNHDSEGIFEFMTVKYPLTAFRESVITTNENWRKKYITQPIS